MVFKSIFYFTAFSLFISFVSCTKQAPTQQAVDTVASTEAISNDQLKAEKDQDRDHGKKETVTVSEPIPEPEKKTPNQAPLAATDDWEIGIPDYSNSSTRPVLAESNEKVPGIPNAISFNSTLDTPLSTFSIDVDTASYSLLRTVLKKKWMIRPSMIRVEEMINYFSYLYPFPVEDPIAIHTEATTCAWNSQHHMLLVGLQSENPFHSPEELPPSNYVFLIDVSGSMKQPDKLPLLKAGLQKLVATLRPVDHVSIVTYAGDDRILAEGISGYEKEQLGEILEQLSGGGGTAGAQGLITAYELAHRNHIAGGNNRIILATDGDFNIGASTEEDLLDLIEIERNAGIFLTILGFGVSYRGNAKMEMLSNHGDGNFFLIDSEQEAEKVLISRLHSNLHILAKDVKVQVVFNPSAIQSYRLLGYTNRALAEEDFEDDLRDAGELGPDQQVTALYEVVLTEPAASLTESELATVKVRYKYPEGGNSRYIDHVVDKKVFRNPADNLNIAASVAALGLFLQQDPHLEGDVLPAIQKKIEPYLGPVELNEFYQLIELLKQR